MFEKTAVISIKTYFKKKITKDIINEFHETIDDCIANHISIVLDFKDSPLFDKESMYIIFSSFLSKFGLNSFKILFNVSNIHPIQKVILETQLFMLFRKSNKKNVSVKKSNGLELLYKYFDTQKKIAKYLGVHRHTVMGWEKKGIIPRSAFRKLNYLTNGAINESNISVEDAKIKIQQLRF